MLTSFFVVRFYSDGNPGFESKYLAFRHVDELNIFYDTLKQVYEKNKHEKLKLFFTVDISVSDVHLKKFNFISAEQLTAERSLRELYAIKDAMDRSKVYGYKD